MKQALCPDACRAIPECVGITLHPPFSHMHWLSENQSTMHPHTPCPTSSDTIEPTSWLTEISTSRPESVSRPAIARYEPSSKRTRITSKYGHICIPTQWLPIDSTRMVASHHPYP